MNIAQLVTILIIPIIAAASQITTIVRFVCDAMDKSSSIRVTLDTVSNRITASVNIKRFRFAPFWVCIALSFASLIWHSYWLSLEPVSAFTISAFAFDGALISASVVILVAASFFDKVFELQIAIFQATLDAMVKHLKASGDMLLEHYRASSGTESNEDPSSE
jgi:hypothetical protein